MPLIDNPTRRDVYNWSDFSLMRKIHTHRLAIARSQLVLQVSLGRAKNKGAICRAGDHHLVRTISGAISIANAQIGMANGRRRGLFSSTERVDKSLWRRAGGRAGEQERERERCTHSAALLHPSHSAVDAIAHRLTEYIESE